MVRKQETKITVAGMGLHCALRRWTAMGRDGTTRLKWSGLLPELLAAVARSGQSHGDYIEPSVVIVYGRRRLRVEVWWIVG
jgi:hypothetical protein